MTFYTIKEAIRCGHRLKLCLVLGRNRRGKMLLRVPHRLAEAVVIGKASQRIQLAQRIGLIGWLAPAIAEP